MEATEMQSSDAQGDQVMVDTRTASGNEAGIVNVHEMVPWCSTTEPVSGDIAAELSSSELNTGEGDICNDDLRFPGIIDMKLDFKKSVTGTPILVGPSMDTPILSHPKAEDSTKEDIGDYQSDSSSLGMGSLFDEGRQSDSSSLGLVTLFDEAIQAQDAAKWKLKGKKERKRLKRKLSLSLESEEESMEAESSDRKVELKEKKPKRQTPNYFVAVRVSNSEIHAALQAVQDAVVDHSVKLKPALVPLATLHITLMVMYLENGEEIEKAKAVLRECKDKIMSLLCGQGLTMNFTGLDHFRNEVLFSKVADNNQVDLLKSIAAVVRETYANAGILSTDDREFQPHLTIMKLSRNPKLRRKGIRKIPMECYLQSIDEHFGVENAQSLRLCSMVHKKTEDGFYLCIETAEFLESERSCAKDVTPSTRPSLEVKESMENISNPVEPLLGADSVNGDSSTDKSKPQVDCTK